MIATLKTNDQGEKFWSVQDDKDSYDFEPGEYMYLDPEGFGKGTTVTTDEQHG
jgi:hypothetical protein